MIELKTELKEYTLWYDGVVEIPPSDLESLFMQNIDIGSIAVTEVDANVSKFNKLSPTKVGLKTEVDAEKISFDWNIPDGYKSLDVEQYVMNEAAKKLSRYSGIDLDKRLNRLKEELKEYKSRDLFPVVQTLIYIIDQFKNNNIVWGVGRGSSCASYVLYILDVHSVDVIKYNIPLIEFFK